MQESPTVLEALSLGLGAAMGAGVGDWRTPHPLFPGETHTPISREEGQQLPNTTTALPAWGNTKVCLCYSVVRYKGLLHALRMDAKEVWCYIVLMGLTAFPGSSPALVFPIPSLFEASPSSLLPV